MTEWILVLYLAGKEPVVTATGYQTAEQCEMAGDLMKAADQAARKTSGVAYRIMCTEQPATR
ncbi:hypothetical protein N7403_31965 [Pseudomonas nitroreducens]|uniref:hypothetical protein n=1 Tax=Pseudomonas nitroreducens TaxID=46680 RepID=UPI00244AB043|nr:hypothetical protein [Pseudomonas nitroreducens]MDG9858491.1 hypothetical protein [Pseudomonas nitroreducens]